MGNQSTTNSNTIVVTTRSKVTAVDHIVEHRKPFPEQHWERLYNIQKDLQQSLEAPVTNYMQRILVDTKVSITLTNLLKVSSKLQKYLQQATIQETMSDPVLSYQG